MYRIATYNLSGRIEEALARRGRALAGAGGADLVFLQEAKAEHLDRFQEAAGLDWAWHVGHDFPEMLALVGRADRRLGNAAIAGRGPRPSVVFPFPDVPHPEKVLAATVDIGGVQVTAVSYHAPHGGLGIVKAEQAVRIAHWLSRVHGPVVMGGDFNTPEIDPVDDAGVRTHWHTGSPHLGGAVGDDVLVGPAPIHRLRDAYRVHLGAHPELRAGLNPAGPLATTHVQNGQLLRYDQLWATPDFTVRDVHHNFELAETRADHGFVIADIDLEGSW